MISRVYIIGVLSGSMMRVERVTPSRFVMENISALQSIDEV